MAYNLSCIAEPSLCIDDTFSKPECSRSRNDNPPWRSVNPLLEKLHLCEAQIDDATAIALENALVGNNTLTELFLAHNNDITDQGWSAFLRALCNLSNIMSTFQSNHTFWILYSYSRSLNWEHVQSLLRLNEETVKAKRHASKSLKLISVDPKALPCSLSLTYSWQFFLTPLLGCAGTVWGEESMSISSSFFATQNHGSMVLMLRQTGKQRNRKHNTRAPSLVQWAAIKVPSR